MKYLFGDKVKILGGFYKGSVGYVVDHSYTIKDLCKIEKYEISINKLMDNNLIEIKLWFDEPYLGNYN